MKLNLQQGNEVSGLLNHIYADKFPKVKSHVVIFVSQTSSSIKVVVIG